MFRDEEAAIRAKERIEEFTGVTLDRLFPEAFSMSPDPDQSVANLERWLRAVGNPGTYAYQLQANLALSKHLMVVLGASQPLSDTLVQNPELAALLFDSAELIRKPTAKVVESEGKALAGVVSSYSHALDRLRYLKQRWTLGIALNDLAGTWAPEATWHALSDLAEGIVRLAVDVVWREVVGRGECPLLVIAFGKLGGRELNYSSDIDLVFVTPDAGLDMGEKEGARFGEALVRALAEPMGRGFLYRVDMRLRPYGKAGPLMPTMRSVESYYELYAEPWEQLALIRSRPLVGATELSDRWNAIVERHAFPPKVSEASVESVVAMRARIEQHSDEDDLKRGPGGIRDVEFLAQTLQFVNAHGRPEMQAKSTLEALAALEEAGLIEHAVAEGLSSGYVFLRQLEHRLQMMADQQTHAVPSDPADRERVARLMGERDWRALSRHLNLHRRTIWTLYQSIVRQDPHPEGDRARVAERLGQLAPAALQWFDPLPLSDAFYQSLEGNEGSLERVRKILEAAPALVGPFKRSVPLTELLLSGEIEEEAPTSERIARLHTDTPLPDLATAYLEAHTRLVARWTLDPCFDVFEALTNLADALVSHCVRRLYGSFDVIALGSYGRMELSVNSDLDVLLLVGSSEQQAEAEVQAQSLLAMFTALKRNGAPVQLDLRLRPEGRQGLLVRTYDGLRAYELERMEMWERFALGQARLVHGSPEAQNVVVQAAYALPLTPERLRELVAMKKRIEDERVSEKYARRHLKLGYGSIGDIEWFVHLHEMRYPTATRPGENVRLDQGIRALGRARLINAIEVEELLHALGHLLDLRLRVALLGYPNDIVPENPDRLDRLARVCGDEDGNAFLRRHEAVIERVREVYQEGMERLRA